MFRMLTQWIVKDWHTHKYLFFALLLLFLTIISTVLYYLNYPRIELNADTPAYLHVVEHLESHPYLLVDTWRLPGYPLLIVLVDTIAGHGNLLAVSIVQAILFVLATLEIYILAILLFRHTWIAFLIGLLVGTNLVLLSYSKPIMSEGLALWQLTTLALALTYFIRTMSVHAFWLVALCIPLLFFTRPEWIYLPLPLFAYLLLVAKHRGVLRTLLRHFVLAFVLITALVSGYILANTFVNHYPGLTAIENFNLLGKVLQYDMQDEASPHYASISHELVSVVARGDKDPYHVLPYLPSLSKDNASLAGTFSRDIIVHHPIEFLLKSVPLCFSSLTAYYDSTHVASRGPFDIPLDALKSIHRWLYGWNICLPFCAVLWVFLLLWRKTRFQPHVIAMGAILLLALYGIVITTLGGYRPDDYMRVHIVFDPLLILIVWGTLLLGAQFIIAGAFRLRVR